MLIRFAFSDAMCYVDGDNAALLTLDNQPLPCRLVNAAGSERLLVAGDTLEFFLQPPGVRDGNGLTLSDAATVATPRPNTDDRYLIPVNAYTDAACELLGIADGDPSNDKVFKDCDAVMVFTPVGENPIQSQPFTLRLKSAGRLPSMGLPTAVPGPGPWLATQAVLFSAAQSLSGPQSLVARTNIGLNNVDNTSDANKPVSAATQTALNLKADATALTSHAGNTSNPHSVTKAQVGLSNVDNTSDANKPLSTAAQTALDAKADSSSLSSHTGNTSNPHSVTKAQVGLGNADNTSDVSKPVSTAQQAALDAKAAKSETDRAFGHQVLTDGATVSWNLSNGSNAVVTLGGNRTLALPTNGAAGLSGTLKIIQDGTGGRALAYAAGWKWSGGTAPVLSAAPGAVDLILWYTDGSNFYGVFHQNFITAPTFVLDEVSGALAAWGIVPLSEAMIGQNGFKLRRTSDDVDQDFAFTDNLIPIAAVASFKGAEPSYPNRAAAFDTVYDQTGNGIHLTQTTDADQPVWQEISSTEAVVEFVNENLSGNGFFPISDESWNARDITIYHVFRGNDKTFSISSLKGGQAPVFGWTSSGAYAGLIENFSGTTYQFRGWEGGGWEDFTTKPSNCQVQTLAIRWNATSTTISLNGQLVYTGLAQTAGTLIDGALGRFTTFGIYADSLQWLASLIFEAQSDGEMVSTHEAIRAQFNLAEWTHNIFFDGDSITAGHDELLGTYDLRWKAWPAELHREIGNPSLRFSNCAVSSETLATMETAASGRVDPHVNAAEFGTNNILVVFAGTNDIHFGADAATTYSRLQTYVTNRYAEGWDKIIVCTAIPREAFNGTQNGYLAAFNASIKADSGDFDGVVELDELAWSFGTHYQGSTPNRVHPNAAGRTLIVNAVKPVLTGIL